MLIGREETHVEVGPDWYDLKTWLGWYDAAEIGAAKRKMIVPISGGQLVAEGAVEVVVRGAPPDLARLRARLVRWSHSEAITEDSIKRIPRAHAKALLAKIAELDRAEDNLALADAEKKGSSAG